MDGVTEGVGEATGPHVLIERAVEAVAILGLIAPLIPEVEVGASTAASTSLAVVQLRRRPAGGGEVAAAVTLVTLGGARPVKDGGPTSVNEAAAVIPPRVSAGEGADAEALVTPLAHGEAVSRGRLVPLPRVAGVEVIEGAVREALPSASGAGRGASRRTPPDEDEVSIEVLEEVAEVTAVVAGDHVVSPPWLHAVATGGRLGAAALLRGDAVRVGGDVAGDLGEQLR